MENSQWYAISDSALKEGMPLPFDLYVVLKRNHKRLRVKLCLHVLKADEIENFKKLSSFETNQKLVELDQIAGMAKRLRLQSEAVADPRSSLPSFIRSREFRRCARRLWKDSSCGKSISLSAVVVFVSHLIDLRLGDYWLDLYNRDVTEYEASLRIAILRVFFAIHTGYTDLNQLQMIFDCRRDSTVEYDDLDALAKDLIRFGFEEMSADRLLISELPIADAVYSCICGKSIERKGVA